MCLWGTGSPVGAPGDDLTLEPALATFSSSTLLRSTSHLRSQHFYLPITRTTEVLRIMPDTRELVKRAPPPKAICPPPEPQTPWSAGHRIPCPQCLGWLHTWGGMPHRDILLNHAAFSWAKQKLITHGNMGSLPVSSQQGVGCWPRVREGRS